MNPSASPLQPTTPVSSPVFPRIYNIVLLLPPILLVCSWILNSGSGYGFSESGSLVISYGAMLTIPCLIAVYVMQWRFISKNYPGRNMVAHLAFAILCGILPFAAAILGDQVGLAKFGGEASSSNILVPALMTGLSAMLGVFYLSCVGNYFYISTKGQMGALRILGIIVNVLAGCAVLVISFFAYSLAIALRDPSTE